MSAARLRVTDVGKPQIVRIMDILMIGPLLIWAGTRNKPLPRWTSDLLVGVGIVTIVYNLNNFYEVRELSRHTYKKAGPKLFTTSDV